MTLSRPVVSPEAEIQIAAERIALATAAYMVRLKDIADIGTLVIGSHGYDYAVTVNQRDKPVLLGMLADLTVEIDKQFGVAIMTEAVAGGV